ncbi:MAG: tetratricopeptide repeat protein [Ignavibacteria bacterium]|nr:tetratricopeptide repeat protein [Ignavibacteria bacterium]
MTNIKPVYCYLIIIAVTFIVFANALDGGFVFDDESVVVNNSSIQNLSNIPKYFTAEEGFHKVIGKYYRPLVSSSYAVDYAIWGLNPYGFHLTNIIIHCIASMLLFRIFQLLFWRYKYRNIFSLLTALIFVVHPVHTEAVTWISGRTDSMVTLFFFASFIFYLEYTREQKHDRRTGQIVSVQTHKPVYLYLSLLFYAVGLLCKEMLVTMPVIILLYDFVYRRKDLDYLRKNAFVYILFGVITVAFMLIRHNLLKDIPDRETYLYFFGKDDVTAIATMLKTVPVYFRLLFAPFGLLYHYNGVIRDSGSFLDLPVVLSVLFIFMLIFASYFFYKRDSIISFAILFFLVTLLPVMNIVPTMNLMAERFLYLVSFSLVLVIAHLCMLGSSKRDKGILLAGMVVIIGSMSFLTYSRNKDWKDNNTLYSSAEGIEGNVLLVNRGNIFANMQKYDDAAKLYKRAIELRENSLLAHHNLGLVYLLKGNLDSAEIRFKRGIQIDPYAPDGYFQMATISNMRNKKDDAIFYLEKLQSVYPDYKNSAQILAELKEGKGDKLSMVPKGFDDKESVDYKKSILQRRSYANFSEGKIDDAIKDLKDLFAITDDSTNKAGILNNIAMCYEKKGDKENEEKHFLMSLDYDPKSINAMNGIAAFYLRQGSGEKAEEYFRKILEISPDNEIAKKKLDSLQRVK